jgi:hypothetical protein
MNWKESRRKRACLRDCPAWQRRASTCGRALLPHADKHMFVYVIELCKSEAKLVVVVVVICYDKLRRVYIVQLLKL